MINIGSIDGIRVPYMETYAYSASKAALLHMTKHLAVMLADEKINVCICLSIYLSISMYLT